MPISAVEIVLLDQVSDYLSIGLRGEAMAFLSELLLKRNVVLDDAVVNHYNLAAAIAVRMCVFFSGAPVSGPAGVSDTVSSVERLEPDHFFQIAQFAFGSPNLKTLAVAADRNSSRVIPAVFKPPQAIQNDGNDPFFANITHDSAHAN